MEKIEGKVWLIMDKRKYGRFKNKKGNFVEIPRFDAEDEPDLVAKITMSVSGWAYERGLDANEILHRVGFVIQRASEDYMYWNETGRKLVEGDEEFNG